MEKTTINNVRLGIFIIAGVLILVISLYMIGQNQNFFGSNFSLKARFRNVNGLMPGNNVRFSGIQCGTVKDIDIIDDTTIEVHVLISKKTSTYIRTDASAVIGTEGLMGNKVINIFPGNSGAPAIADGGMLRTGREKGLDDMLSTLSVTGDNASAISSDLRETAERINNSSILRELLADTTIVGNLRQSLENIRSASVQIQDAAHAVNLLTGSVRKGEGVAGVLLADPDAAEQISQTIEHIRNAAERADKLVANLDSLATDARTDMNQGTGAVHLLLKDTAVVRQLQNSLENVETGTRAFSADMEALKHNFLLRGYFRKQERKNK